MNGDRNSNCSLKEFSRRFVGSIVLIFIFKELFLTLGDIDGEIVRILFGFSIVVCCSVDVNDPNE